MTASVLLTLDTTAPTVQITIPATVEPPDNLIFDIVSSEDIGTAAIAVVDALGQMTYPGYQLLDARTLHVLLPTGELASGPATVMVSVADEALNFTRLTRRVTISRPRAFDVVLDLEPVYAVDLSLDGGYDIETGIGHAHHITLETF